MEVYLNFNCFATLAFLYLITLELPHGAYSIPNKSSTAQSTDISISSTNNNNIDKIYHLLRHGYPSLFHKSKMSKKTPLISSSHPSPYSSSQSSLGEPFSSHFPPDSSPERSLPFLARNKKKKVTPTNLNPHTRKSNLNDILIILSNNNKTGNISTRYSHPRPSGLPFAPSEHLIRAKDGENNKATGNTLNVSTLKATNKPSYQYLGKFEGKNVSESDRSKTSPTATSSKKGYYIAQPNKEKEIEKHSNDDLFPVAFLMNSQLELEPVRMITTHMEKRMGSSHRGVGSRKVRFSESMSDNPPGLALRLESKDNSKGIQMAAPVDLTTLYYESEGGTSAPSSTVLPATTVFPEESLGGDNETITGGDKTDLYNQTVGSIALRGKCNDTIQCFGEHVECRLGICKCQLGYLPRVDNGELCGEASAHHVEVPTTDPTMIGVVVGLALMSVTLCIVLRLFAKARFRENRTIFNTPNPRLMNVSLLKGSKTLLRGNSAGGQRSRRGSQVSMASGQIEGESPVNSGNEGNGAPSGAGSSHPHRVKPSRTLSTDTTNQEGTPTSSRPPASGNRSKFRQDSVASNV